MLNRPHLPGAPDARLHLVRDEQNAVPIADPAQLLKKFGRRIYVAALALNRFHENRSYFITRHVGSKQLLLDNASAVYGTVDWLQVVHAAVAICVRDVSHAGNQRAKVPPLDRPAG